MVRRACDIGNIVRFTPSACNTQPWKVEADEHRLKVYRDRKPEKRGITPIDKAAHYNRIGIGIFLFFLDLCLMHNGITFERRLFADDNDDTSEDILAAEYIL